MLKQRLDEICTPNVTGVAPETTVAEAVQVMREKSFSFLPVLDQGAPVGVITERSILSAAVEHPNGYLKLPVSVIMTSPVVTATGDSYMFEAYNMLATRKIRHLVLVDDEGAAWGVLTLSDMIRHLGVEYFVEVKKISNIMTTRVFTATLSMPLTDAMAAMASRSISCLIALRDGEPAGILTERDLTRLLVAGTDMLGVTVGEVMAAPLITMGEHATVHEAAELMAAKKVRRLVVMDFYGEMSGLITQSDIIRGLEGKYIETLKQIIQEKDIRLMEVGQDLRETSLYLEHILRSAIDMGIVATDEHYRLEYCNPFAERLFGVHAGDILGRDLRDIHREQGVDESRFARGLDVVRRGGTHEFSCSRTISGEEKVLQARMSGIRNENGGLIGFVLMVKDVTERRKTEETIRHMAYHDMLTDLPNRTLFGDRLHMELARAERNRQPVAVLLMDLDRFKEVNDVFGHAVGDELLKAVARRLKTVVRRSDTVARMGGDEFLFILPGVQEQGDLEETAAKILAAVERPVELQGEQVSVGASIGAAVYPEHGHDEKALVRMADQAMYRAKREGRRQGRSCLVIGGAGGSS
jgi:diguanylate cyclase (GGDEF)-like protein/PAS domain S-box-containing protein